MPRPYKPLALANEFICFDPSYGVSHMKLQKLVYFAHGWWLTRHHESLLDEAPEVWRHGPVFSSLYNSLAGFGPNRIKNPVSDVFGNPPRVDEDDAEVFDLLRFVWGRYGHMTAFQLSDLTHRPGTPWQIIAEQRQYRVPRHFKIDQELIRNEFMRLRNENQAAG